MKQQGRVTWDFLVNNLQQQVQVYTRLNAILEQENKILISHQVDALNYVTEHKDRENEKLVQLDQELRSIIAQIVIGEDPKKVNLDFLINVSPAKYKSILNQQRDQLADKRKTLRKFNFMNQKLIENSMKYVRYMMKKIMEVYSDQQQVYTPGGSAEYLGGERNYMNVVA